MGDEMKLLLKQCLSSFGYDVYAEDGKIIFTARGHLFDGENKLEVHDTNGNHVATIQEKAKTFLPQFEIYIGGDFIGVTKNITFFKPSFTLDIKNAWSLKGSLREWNYVISDQNGVIAKAKNNNKFFNFSDAYVIDVENDRAVLPVLMIIIAARRMKAVGVISALF